MQALIEIDELIMQLSQSTSGVYLSFGCVIALICLFIVAKLIHSFRG